jgi:hypothetical protein
MAGVTWLAESDGKRQMHHSRRSRPYNSVVRRLRTVGPQKSSIAPQPKAISKAPFTLTFARQPKALRFTREEDLQGIRYAELVARGLRSFMDGTANVPRLTSRSDLHLLSV